MAPQHETHQQRTLSPWPVGADVWGLVADQQTCACSVDVRADYVLRNWQKTDALLQQGYAQPVASVNDRTGSGLVNQGVATATLGSYEVAASEHCGRIDLPLLCAGREWISSTALQVLYCLCKVQTLLSTLDNDMTAVPHSPSAKHSQ